MLKKDYYEIFGVGKDVIGLDVKKVYCKLVMKYYFDCNLDDVDVEVKFKEVSEVYEVLLDVQKKEVYDCYGYVGVDFNMGGGGFYLVVGGVSFSDIFGDVFGDIFGGVGVVGGCGGVCSNWGFDLCYILELDLEEVVKGISVEIRVLMLVNCEICDGGGVKKGISLVICIICNGVG